MIPTDQELSRSLIKCRWIERFLAPIIPLQNLLPDILRRFSKPEDVAVLDTTNSLIHQEAHVKGLTPLLFPDQHDRNLFNRSRLNQGKSFKRLV